MPGSFQYFVKRAKRLTTTERNIMLTAAEKTAIRFAERGWFVFPIQENSNEPLTGRSWEKLSTNDPKKVRAYADALPGHNWGLNCGKSGLTVLDLDRKNGKNGVQALDAAGLEPTETWLVATANGGYHYYYEGEGANSASMIAEGVDTRGRGGYVVIPGSVINGREYKLYQDDIPVAKVPSWATGKKSVASEEEPQDLAFEWDAPGNVEAATLWLGASAPAADEGTRNDTAYKVACALRDRGVSMRVGLDLMREWNDDKCSPPLSDEELHKATKSAYKTAQLPPGTKTPEKIFAEPPVEGFIKDAAGIDWDGFKPRKWVLGTRYLKKNVTVIAAPGGVGKSLLTINDAMSVATGRQLGHDEVKCKGPAWILNLEDTEEELSRRIVATARANGVSKKELDKSGFFYSSGFGKEISIAAKTSNGVVINDKFLDYLIAEIKKRGVTLLIVDPFVSLHNVSENDNSDINKVVKGLLRVAEEGDCAIGVVHHYAKGKAATPGDPDSIRGAGSLVFAARVATTVTNMSAKDAERFGVPRDERWRYLRIDNAKVNFSAPGADTKWFRRESVVISPGLEETTGALIPQFFDDVFEDEDEDVEPEKTLNEYLLDIEFAPGQVHMAIREEVIPALIELGYRGPRGGINKKRVFDLISTAVKTDDFVGLDSLGMERRIYHLKEQKNQLALVRSFPEDDSWI
jgi:Mrp family chromosome partitioning ATPase